MKNRNPEFKQNNEGNNFSRPKSVDMKKKKNMQRLGGGGLSLEAFANAKSTTINYNPALIKKKREFYKNAKYVSKYKKLLQQQSQNKEEGENEGSHRNKQDKRKNKKKGLNSLNILYEKQREEKEKARIEREAIIQAKKEEREKAEAQRKTSRENMLKRTRHGQPVMKYRIEHVLQSIQGSTSNSVNDNR